MHIKNKSLRAVLIAFAVATAALFTGGIKALNAPTAHAEEERENYYYGQLNGEEKKFYDAISQMDEQGLLKKGNEKYDLIANQAITESQLEAFSRNQSVLSTFGAARDAYYLDHPEVFYVDFSYLSISVGKKGENFVATLGTGRADNYYVQNAFYSETDVNNAIAQYDAAVTAIAAKANEQTTVADKIKSVNLSLAESVEYSFCTESADAPCAPHIRNSYGALVNHKAVCEGFARSFKCVMDKLGIPCVIVHGYASNEGELEPHAWNYVEVEDSYYGVDVTWNNTTGFPESYLLCGEDVMNEEHVPDGVISAANRKFSYPPIAKAGYGSKGDESIQVEEIDQGDGSIQYKVSMDGMNSTELAEKGLWLSSRYYSDPDGSGLVWSEWSTFKHALGGIGMPDGDGYSPTYINSNVMYVQFGVLSGTPTDFGKFGADAHLITSTKYYKNDGYSLSFGAPYVKTTSPDKNAANLDVTQTYTIEITYTQDLKIVDVTKPIGLKVSTINPDAEKYAEIPETVTFDGKDKISFEFTPSAMYQHRDEVYTFTPTNLVGKLSDKVPMSVAYLTENKNVACNRVYPDGRLYVNSYGQPSLVGSGDLSMTGWKYGTNPEMPVGESQRSQLMLVATKTTDKEGKEMMEHTGLPEGAVKKSETFEIQLNLCKNIVRIPNGSTVQVAFGFPEGYGPEDEGVTFKVYHFKRGDDGKIDYSKTVEVDCVITEYGLMVNVDDFSPFAVVAVDKSQVTDLKKSVFARSVGFGGSFEGEIAQLVGSGNSVTYTLHPEDGYKVAKATLNGEDLEVNGNTLTLTYDQLADRNNIEFYYVAESVEQYEASNGITTLYAGPPEIPAPGGDDNNDKPDNTLMIVLITVGAVAVCAAVAVAIILLRKKRNK